jgi:RNA polymerase sigma-70 factor, ECF subfamily
VIPSNRVPAPPRAHGVGTPPWDWPSFRRYARRVAVIHARQASDAEDIAQEAVLRAWRMQRSCRAPEDPWPWLRQIVLREVARHYGRPWHREVVTDASAERSEDLDPEEAERRADVARAMGRLDPADRVLLHLRYDADLTQSSIADRLDMPEGTVKVRLHRARNRLREDLEN